MEKPHLPDEWLDALARLRAARRTLVLGAADVGKSSFVHAALSAKPGLRLLDLDPGQKMVGPPGTVSLGAKADGQLVLERFRFVGTTSAGQLRLLFAATSAFASQEPLIANTSGFGRDPGTPVSPAPPDGLDGAARPICALVGRDGEHLSLAVLAAIEEDGISVIAPPIGAPPASLILGRMWVEPSDGDWHLLERTPGSTATGADGCVHASPPAQSGDGARQAQVSRKA